MGQRRATNRIPKLQPSCEACLRCLKCMNVYLCPILYINVLFLFVMIRSRSGLWLALITLAFHLTSFFPSEAWMTSSRSLASLHRLHLSRTETNGWRTNQIYIARWNIFTFHSVYDSQWKEIPSSSLLDVKRRKQYCLLLRYFNINRKM